jgi:hypothetical protein
MISPMQRHLRLLGTIICIILVAGCAELAAYLFSCYLVKYPIGFTPLHITKSYESYLIGYHSPLSWRSSVLDDDGNYRCLAGSSQYQDKSPACVSLYGDSFTEGFGVNPVNSWSFLLSQSLHCRVANFGVSGFGTDQAYLKFSDNQRDQAKVVILGFLSENVTRNVNQLRNLISNTGTYQPKPRFILDEHGQLNLVPIPPQLTKEQYETIKNHPELFFHHEFFLPGGPSGCRQVAFPYTWGILKAFPLIFKNVVLHQGVYYDLYRSGHPSQAVEVTCAILEAFCREAKQRGKKPLVLVIPTHVDLAYFRRLGAWIYQPVTGYLSQKGLDFIDMGPKFIQFLGEAGLDTLYSPETQYHLNQKGNAVLAQAVYDYLMQKNFNLGTSEGIEAGQKCARLLRPPLKGQVEPSGASGKLLSPGRVEDRN